MPIISVYNQYPGFYENIAAMQADLKRIADLGFTHVWINPLYKPCQENLIEDGKDRRFCPYAMQDHREINKGFANNFEEIKEYVQAISNLKMSPVLDLVGRHVAWDHPFVKNSDPDLNKQKIDTSKWFQKHPNGNLVIHNMDENYVPIPGRGDPWCDIASFNYETPEITNETFAFFWEAFLEFNIGTLGFKDIRLDAPFLMEADAIKRFTEVAKKLCLQYHGREPVIIAETVGNTTDYQINKLNGCGITHPMNSVYWMPGPVKISRDDYSLWRSDYNWFTHSKGLLQQLGPTIGYAGSHDEPRYVQELIDKAKIPNDKKILATYMKIKIAASVFSSEGGWALFCGDEFGDGEKADLLSKNPKAYFTDESLRRFDLSNFIRAVNNTLKQFNVLLEQSSKSATSEPAVIQWQQRVFLDSFPEAVIFFRRYRQGYSGKSHLVIANASEEKTFVFSEEIFEEIMRINGRNEAIDKLPDFIFLCGDEFDIHLEKESKFSVCPIYHCSSKGIEGFNINLEESKFSVCTISHCSSKDVEEKKPKLTFIQADDLNSFFKKPTLFSETDFDVSNRLNG